MSNKKKKKNDKTNINKTKGGKHLKIQERRNNIY